MKYEQLKTLIQERLQTVPVQRLFPLRAEARDNLRFQVEKLAKKTDMSLSDLLQKDLMDLIGHDPDSPSWRDKSESAAVTIFAVLAGKLKLKPEEALHRLVELDVVSSNPQVAELEVKVKDAEVLAKSLMADLESVRTQNTINETRCKELEEVWGTTEAANTELQAQLKAEQEFSVKLEETVQKDRDLATSQIQALKIEIARLQALPITVLAPTPGPEIAQLQAERDEAKRQLAECVKRSETIEEFIVSDTLSEIYSIMDSVEKATDPKTKVHLENYLKAYLGNLVH